MHPLLIKIKPQKDMKIPALFDNGKSKVLDIKPYLSLFKPFKKLENEALFRKVRVDYGGHAAVWNDEIDLDAMDIWEEGVEVKDEKEFS